MNTVQEFLKSGCPTIWVLTSGDPFRSEKVIPCDGWRFLTWDCSAGIRQPNSSTIVEQIFDPVEAIRYLDNLTRHCAHDTQSTPIYGFVT